MRNKLFSLIIFFKLVLPFEVAFGQSDMLYFQGVDYKASSGETPAITFLKGSGYAKLGFFIDEPSKYTFMVEAKTNLQGVVSVKKDSITNSNPNIIKFGIKPARFKVLAGK